MGGADMERSVGWHEKDAVAVSTTNKVGNHRRKGAADDEKRLAHAVEVFVQECAAIMNSA
jgi:hypothetical protein